MAIEIERKFLVNSRWRDAVPKEWAEITQGYLPTKNGVTARVRITEKNGMVIPALTIKGPNSGISRPEFEYEIPLDDAQEMLEMCGKRLIVKVRLTVPSSRRGLSWEIDVFKGRHNGLVLAEIELDRPDRKVKLPHWVGLEVSGEQRFSNHSLALHGLGLLRDLVRRGK